MHFCLYVTLAISKSYKNWTLIFFSLTTSVFLLANSVFSLAKYITWVCLQLKYTVLKLVFSLVVNFIKIISDKTVEKYNKKLNKLSFNEQLLSRTKKP